MTSKTIVITGASVGIGASVARRFAKDDVQLVLIARRKDKLESLQKELGSEKTSIYVLDVTDRKEVQKIFASIGPIDILVNNAGGAFGLDKAQDANLDDWDTCVAVNINGLLYCTHSALPGMVKRNRGHIFNLGSVAGSYPYPAGNVYSGVKAFVHQFSLGLRADLLGTKVRVSCIEPGIVSETEFSQVRFKGDEKKVRSVYDKTEPLKPEDIAEIIYFTAHLPPHVNINTVEIMPVYQAFSPLAIYREP